ncbi:MAG TPA: HIT family protein [Planctomycetota bacterium]|nr:HIT family protein [Planctomycetota bacterium]
MPADCIFCRIVAGEIPAQKVHDDPRVLAILDINPVSWGHVLVLPKEHHETWLDLPPDLAAHLATATQKVGAAVKTAAGAEGFNLLMNNHRCSGQAIFHAHFHIIPRKTNDGKSFEWKTKPYDAGQLDKAADAVRAALK